MRSKSRKWSMVMGLIALISLALGGGIAWFLAKRDTSGDNIPQKEIIDTQEPENIFRAPETIEGGAVKRVIATWPDGSDREIEYVRKEDNETVKRITYSNSGRKEREKTYFTKNGEKISQEKAWSENGVLMYIRHKKKDRLHGEFKRFWPTGFCRQMGEYVDGKRVGAFYYWYKNGIRQRTENYRDGRLHGIIKKRDRRGNLTVKGRFKNGERTGMWYFYDIEAGVVEKKDFSTSPEGEKEIKRNKKEK